ncbi:hypothetical protein LR48_Vigan02g096800 [Vigna angularis]|uniref:Uncharacterized protein n=1 Tax=Phaseolus angularis TaxID=3914 RepID=A0A0L9TW53_PHAAN|nr:hypothetical protein LR48_Vigan02g096800 [Vigna angularis]
MDRSWMNERRISEEYDKGVLEFLQYVEQNAKSVNRTYFYPQAQVPVPTPEINFVGEAIGSFIAWPRALIMSHIATPQFTRPQKQPIHDTVIHEDDDMDEAEDDPLSKLMTRLPRYMDTIVVDQGRSSMYGFVEPQTIQPSGNTLENRQHYLQTWMNEMQFGQEFNYTDTQDTQFHQGNFNHWWKPHLNMGQSQFGQAAEQFDRLPQQQWQQQPSLSKRMAKMDDTLQQLMQMSDSHHKSTQPAFKRIGRHLCHISEKLDDLGSNMKVNPMEECQAIITRSDKVLDERKIKRKEERLSEKEKDVKEEEEKEERKSEVERKEKGKNVEEERKETKEVEREKKKIEKNLLSPKECSKEEKEGEEKKKREKEDERKKKESYEKLLPHPKKYHRKEKEKHFERFMEIFKKLEIKIPIIGTLQQVLEVKLVEILSKVMQFGQEFNYTDTQFHQGNFNHWWKPHLNMGQSRFGQATEQFDRLPQQQWQQQPSLSKRMAKMDDTLQQLMQMSDSHHKSTQPAFKRIGRHLCHISEKLDDLGSNMKVNPMEECQAIITRSDKVLDERKIKRKEERLSEKEKDVKEEEEKEERKSEVERKEKGKNVEEERKETKEVEREKKKIEKNLLSPKECSKEEKEGEEKKKREKEDERKKKESYEKLLPHPKKYHRKEKEKHFERFMEIFKKLEIKIPIIGTLQQVPEEKAQGSRGGVAEASAMDDEDAFEDAEDDEEEEDSDDNMGEFGERSEEGESGNQKRHQKVQKEKPQLPLSGSLPLSGTQELTGDPLRGKMAVEGKKPTHALTAEQYFTAERHTYGLGPKFSVILE